MQKDDLLEYIDGASVVNKVYSICEIHRNVTVYVARAEDGEIDISWERQENTVDEIIDEVGDFHYERTYTN